MWRGCGPRLLQRLQDGGGDSFRVFEDVAIPETQNAEALGFKPGCSRRVGFRIGMLAAIGFDDQFQLQAGEVRHEAADRTLAAEFDAAEGTIAQEPPQGFLGFRGVAS